VLTLFGFKRQTTGLIIGGAKTAESTLKGTSKKFTIK